MTLEESAIEERVDGICKWNNPGLRALVVEAMREAVEEEREECEITAADIESQWATGNGTYAEGACRAAAQIKQAIRARGKK